MNIVHISDSHGGKINPGKACDLLILSGDIAGHSMKNFTPMLHGKPSPFGWKWYDFRLIDKEAEAISQANWINNQVVPRLKKKGLDLDKVIFVNGNHDFFNPTPIFKNSIKTGSKTILVNGIKVGLLAGVLPVTGEWNDEIPEHEIRQRILALDPDIEILVSHTAPYGIRDSNYGGEHTGSKELTNAIFGSKLQGLDPYFTKLTLHTYGHSHEGFGGEKHEVGDRTIRFSNGATGRVDITF